MKNLVLATVTAGLMFACTNAPVEKETAPVNTTAPAPAPAEEHHHHDASEVIELNNGAKWQVNPEMMEYIKIMESDVTKFDSNADLQAYEQLGKSLQKNIDLLTSSCTMKGKAHDELHKWLLPFIETVDELNKTKTAEEASAVFEKIKSSFVTFHQYFE